MALWEKILLALFGLILIFWFLPGIKASIQRSKQAEEKHWGTVIGLAALLVMFVMFLIWSVR